MAEMPEATTAPDALCCPISMEIMRDPVIAADGHTYERVEIESWFANNRTSPTVWKSTSASGAPAVRNRHRHAIEHTSHQWRGVDAMIQHERAVKF